MITTRHDLRRRLERDRFALLEARDVRLCPVAVAAWRELQSEWKDLPTDPYMRDGADYRKRRFGLFDFEPLEGVLAPVDGASYHQPLELNAYAGGKQRAFASLSAAALANPFLVALIRFDFAQLPVSALRLVNPWRVDVHMVRIEAHAGRQGHPTPEGLHRDGEEFVCVHLVGRDNVAGGETTICGEDRAPITRTTLVDPLDSYYLWDRHVLHEVSPIVQKAPGRPAFRDALLIGFEPVPVEADRRDRPVDLNATLAICALGRRDRLVGGLPG